MIYIDITDGTVTLRENGVTETIEQSSYSEAQEAAVSALIGYAEARGDTVHAITSEKPPSYLVVHSDGRVEPQPASQAPIDQEPVATAADRPTTPEQPSEPEQEQPMTSADDQHSVTAAEVFPSQWQDQPGIDDTPTETAQPSQLTTAAVSESTRPEGKTNPLTGEATEPQSRRDRRIQREQRQSFLTAETHEQPASRGWRGLMNSMGIRVAPSEDERAEREDFRLVSQHWPGPRTIAVVNGKGGSTKTPSTVLLSAVFARFGGGGVLAWDNNQTRGTLGWRTEQAGHESTILDLLPNTERLLATGAQSADLAHYMHHQTADRFDVLRSKPMVLADEQRVRADDVDAIHQVASKFYRLIFIDSGNDESDPLWKRMVDHADQIVVATTTKDEHAEAGALLLEALADRDQRCAALADNAVAIVSQAEPGVKHDEAESVRSGFAELAREAVTIPFDPAIVDGRLRYDALRPATQRAWLRAAAAVAEGLH